MAAGGSKLPRLAPPRSLEEFLSSSVPDVLVSVFACMTAREVLVLRSTSRALRAASALHARGDHTPITGSLAAWRACFPHASVASVAWRRFRDDDEDLTSLCGFRMVDLSGMDQLTDASLAQLHDIAFLRLTASETLSPTGIDVIARTGCDIRVFWAPQLIAAGIAASVSLATLLPGTEAHGLLARIGWAASATIAQSALVPGMPDVDLYAAFHSAGCCDSLVRLLSFDHIEARVLRAACRAVVLQTGCAAGAVAFLDSGGPAVLARLLLHAESTVVLTACEAVLDMLQVHESEEANDCVLACLLSGGSAALKDILGGTCCDDLLVRTVCDILFTSHHGAEAFVEAGGIVPLLKLLDTADCLLGVVTFAFVGLLRGAARSVTADAILLNRGVERLVAVLARTDTSGCHRLCFVLGDLSLFAVAVDALIDAGGVEALVPHLLPSALAAGILQPEHHHFVADVICKVLLPLTEPPRGRAAFERVGGKAALTASLAWSVNLAGLSTKMAHAIALGVYHGVVAPPS